MGLGVSHPNKIVFMNFTICTVFVFNLGAFGRIVVV